MAKGESVVSYLTRIRQIEDELAAVGDKIDDSELVKVASNGFSKRWDIFVSVIAGRENILDSDRLWDDFTQEELRLSSLSRGSSNSHKEKVRRILP